MTTTIVIPVKSGNKHKNKELIYAIRSLQKHLKGNWDIVLVGDMISALRGLKYIHCKDEPKSENKERNIYRKIMKACESDLVSENFVVTNDDIYLTKDFHVDCLPYYYKCELETTMANNKGDYRKSLNHTRKFLLEHGKKTLDFDTHFPIMYNKKSFCTFVYQNVDWNKPFGYVIKSLYANGLGIEGEFGGDCKIHHKMSYQELKTKIGDKPFFSTSDGCLNEDMMRLLNELYPEKGRYER